MVYYSDYLCLMEMIAEVIRQMPVIMRRKFQQLPELPQQRRYADGYGSAQRT